MKDSTPKQTSLQSKYLKSLLSSISNILPRYTRVILILQNTHFRMIIHHYNTFDFCFKYFFVELAAYLQSCLILLAEASRFWGEISFYFIHDVINLHHVMKIYHVLSLISSPHLSPNLLMVCTSKTYYFDVICISICFWWTSGAAFFVHFFNSSKINVIKVLHFISATNESSKFSVNFLFSFGDHSHWSHGYSPCQLSSYWHIDVLVKIQLFDKVILII